MFAEHAPLYWAKGMPAIPLRPSMKVPAITAWSQFASQMPTAEQQADWLSAYPDGNIGLPLGPQSGVIGLDLDSEDEQVLRLLEKHMPHTPWKRVGKKGAVYAFKYNGERTYRIKDEDNKTIVELLSGGCQIVLPPSIHPETQRAYESTGDLWNMRDELPSLPLDFEASLREGLIVMGYKLTTRGRAKVSEWTPAGGRDSAMISNAGILARAVLRGERSLLEAMHEMEIWCETYTERVVGDPIDVSKGRGKIMEFIQRDLNEGKCTLPPTWSAGMLTEDIDNARALFGEDVEEWTLKQTIEELERQFSEVPDDDTTARTMIMEAALRRVAKSASLTEIDHDVIARYIAQANGKLITIAAIRIRLKQLMRSSLSGNDHAEIAEALLSELQREGETRYHTTRFYRWKGSHWGELDQDIDIMRPLIKEFGNLPAAKRWSDHKGIIQVLSKLAAYPLRTSDVVTGINFANGFLTPDMELLPHEENLGCTYVLPYRYIENDRAPTMWLSLLDQCWGEEPDYVERVQALREAIASTLFGTAYRYARAFCLFGVAHSGKTTILDVIRGLIPSGASAAVPPDSWGDRFMPAMMEGKLINFCGELSENRLINGATFKTVVEGTEMSAQFKNLPIFQFSPTCAQWFAGNHPPRSRDSSEGFSRRWLFWTFNKKVTLDQKREGLVEEILSEEREAIVAWAAPAIKDLQRRADYDVPVSSTAMEQSVTNQNNSVRQYLVSGSLIIAGKEQCEETGLYLSYHMYCKVIGKCEPVSRTRFRRMMDDLSHKFNFRIELNQTSEGVEDVQYKGLSVRKGKL